MKRCGKVFIYLIGIYLFPISCIVPFEPSGRQESDVIIVVEGMIMDKDTKIRLNKAVSMYNNSSEPVPSELKEVHGASLQVIDENNNIIAIAEEQIVDGKGSSVYAVDGEIIFTSGTKYALAIQIGEKHYQSAFVAPVKTPEIDELSWRKNADGSMDIMVTTRDQESQTKYYRWAFEEDWEIRSHLYASARYEDGVVIQHDIFTSNNRFYCWASEKSKSIILGTSDRQTEATIKDKVIHNFADNNTRFSYLYSILVKQYGIDREAYIYYDNLQKNMDLSGSLFAPLLTEVRGNVACLTDPDEPVIGYIGATNNVMQRIFIDMLEIDGEDMYGCEETKTFTYSQLVNMFAAGYGIISGQYVCAPVRCVDCTKRGGTKNKPDFWPNDHL
jgi:hypothetical protein